MYRFKIEHKYSYDSVHWFLVKDKYWVRIDTTGKSSCECLGFTWGITRGTQCKHIKEARYLLQTVKEHHEEKQDIKDL